LLLLLPTTTYRADGFVAAASRLALNLTVASEIPSAFQDQNPDGLVTLPLDRPESAVASALAFAQTHPLDAVVGVDDDTAVLAAMIARAVGVRGNPVASVRAARDKHRQRVLFRKAHLAVPDFRLSHFDEDIDRIVRDVEFPCVVKPLSLSASRGVMRVDDTAAFGRARDRLAAILQDASSHDSDFLVESFVSGPEVAVEGVVQDGRLHVLAIFDKPDPLNGPYFEETIYVTPSRMSESAQTMIVECVARGVAALGLRHGPIHAEVRMAAAGPVIIEMAARPIGGKCSRALRFGLDGEMSLEELLVRHVLGDLDEIPSLTPGASGVMMIPTPRAGTLRGVGGRDQALLTSGIDEVLITIPRGTHLVPLPEGSRYLGFIFARAETADEVETALRKAHERLVIDVSE
jgi:formate-dependent phosphoribosylglycinamide formyltransferase (GAR transformylase)